VKPGIYPGLAMPEYLAMPAVSSHLLKTLLERCPRAAWFDSWLNPKRPADESKEIQNVGTIAHSVLLEGSTECVAVIDPRDHPNETGGGHAKGWTNKSIKAARDAAIAAGKVPIFPETMREIEAMVAAAREYIDAIHPKQPAIWAMFQPGGGESETTFVWEDDGVLCRIRPDRISTDRRVTANYKTVSTCAQPDTWARMALFKMGYHLSASFYRRGIRATCGGTPEDVFLVQEQEAPYLCSLVGLDPMANEYADSRIAAALDRWRACAKSGQWDGYPADVCYPEIPAWELGRQITEDELPGTAYDPAKLWQKSEHDPLYQRQ
jgi:hypothetical protein